jgi:hypothetical protein
MYSHCGQCLDCGCPTSNIGLFRRFREAYDA